MEQRDGVEQQRVWLISTSEKKKTEGWASVRAGVRACGCARCSPLPRRWTTWALAGSAAAAPAPEATADPVHKPPGPAAPRTAAVPVGGATFA